MEILEELFQYYNWANDILLMTLEKYGPQVPPASMRLMSHIVNVQVLWLSRIKGETPAVGVWEEHDLATCKQLNKESLQRLRSLIDQRTDNFATIVAYKNSSGIPYETAVLDILLQTLNHGTYHRGQIAMDLRQAGLEPVNTDYISWVRATRR